MPSMIEVMESRIGIQEIKGPKHTKAILDMWIDAGHPEIQTDEEFWCSACMCSAAKAASMPMPPVNVNPMARSWLTWGVTIEHKDVARGDVTVWPSARGSSSGHVNIVAEVREFKGKVQVKCVGGNQSHTSGGAVTLTGWQDISGALKNGVRRGVAPTVKDLRNAGSTTIKTADTKEKLGIFAAFFVPIFEGIKTLFGPVDVPQFATLPEGLSWWQSVLGGVNAVASYAIAHPVLAAVVIAGLGLWTLSRIEKKGRVAEHAAGIPIAAEVAKLGAA